MQVEGGNLYVVRMEGEEERFELALDEDKLVVFIPQHFDDPDGRYTAYMNMTRSIFTIEPDDLPRVHKVFEKYEHLMTLYFQILKNESRDYPYPKEWLTALFDLNLTERESKVVSARLKEFTYIYLIKDNATGLIKIGQSGDPERRLKQLIKQDTLMPSKNDFVIVRCWEDYPYKERVLHEHFQAKRIRGEWFELSHEDLEEVKFHFAE